MGVPELGKLFVRVGSGVYLRQTAALKSVAQIRVENSAAAGQQPIGQERTSIVPVPSPSLVLIFGWMGSSMNHLHKYTRVYETLYPNAAQLLITCDKSIFWTDERRNQLALLPAAEVLEAHVNAGDNIIARPQARILVHSFSNGKFASIFLSGAIQLVTLGRLLKFRQSKMSCAASALVIDSAPGDTNLQQALLAFTGLVSNPFLKVPVRAFIFVLWGFSGLLRLFGVSSILDRMKRRLQEPDLLPWMSATNTPRLYVYSKTDAVVSFEQVQKHIAGTRARGVHVREEVFEDSPHVAHGRTDPERYWAAVQSLWRYASAPSSST
ncbi:hypothetical protein FISHEDRAFT_37901 [Fistulina hepatica ATCC 64428]|nr:hypothetical protein FISHEDRAFT_37901 [Fistulina hepatica ATCC 64428]